AEPLTVIGSLAIHNSFHRLGVRESPLGKQRPKTRFLPRRWQNARFSPKSALGPARNFRAFPKPKIRRRGCAGRLLFQLSCPVVARIRYAGGALESVPFWFGPLVGSEWPFLVVKFEENPAAEVGFVE